MDNRFFLNEETVKAIMPLQTTRHPRNAALGRIAEPLIKERVAAQLGMTLSDNDTLFPSWLHKHINPNGIPNFDGVLLAPEGYLHGVNESKLMLNTTFTISTHEILVVKECLLHHIPYIVSLARYISERTNACDYIGYFRMTSEVFALGKSTNYGREFPLFMPLPLIKP